MHFENAESESAEFQQLRRRVLPMAAKDGDPNSSPRFKYGPPEDLLITDVGELLATIGVTLKDESKVSEEVGTAWAVYIDDLSAFDIDVHQGQAKPVVEALVSPVKHVLANKPIEFDRAQWETEVQTVLNELWRAFDARSKANKELRPGGSSIVTKAKKLLPRSGNDAGDESSQQRRGTTGGSGNGGGGLLAGSSKPQNSNGILRGQGSGASKDQGLPLGKEREAPWTCTHACVVWRAGAYMI